MSGHSKWATIRHKKGAADAKRGKIFTKIIKKIIVSARLGGGDIESNPRLRAAVLKARGSNMPKDNIERGIKKGTGDLEGANYTERKYEGYASGGVAIMVETLTDNKNRTAADIRSIFNKAGGSLGESGCVSYMFKKKGIIILNSETSSEEEIFELALEHGAEDVKAEDGSIEIITAPDDFETVVQALDTTGIPYESAEVELVADTTMTLDHEGTRKVLRLIENLEDNDDVQTVSSNLEIPEDFDVDE